MRWPHVCLATLLLWFNSALVARAGYVNGDCILVHPNGVVVSYVEWMYGLSLHSAVLDTAQPGTEISRFETVNVAGIVSHHSKHIHVALIQSTLVLTLKKEFEMFEEREYGETAIKLNVDFQCTDGASGIVMWGAVEDSNNHSPRFESPTGYTYILPLPFPPGLPLGCATGLEIGASDVDLGNTRVSFRLSSGLLTVSGGWVEGRTFYANLTATRFITEEANVTITAADDGDPQKTTATTIYIKADPHLSLKRTGHGKGSLLEYKRP